MSQPGAEPYRKRNWKENAYLIFTGMVTGAANIIPGVSGGTMAFIMGIYEELLEAVKSFNLHLLQLVLRGRLKAAWDYLPMGFLIPLGIGLGVSIFALAGIISWLLVHHTVLLYAFFFGLILASILTISTQVRWRVATLIALALGAAIAWILIGMVPRQMPHTPLILFISGMVAIIAMILPGISGSFIILIMGQYDYVINLVKSFEISGLLILGAGIVAGMLAFVRVLSWLLRHYHQATIALLTGFMLGSLRKIWPFKETLEAMLDRHGNIVPIRERNIMPDFSSGIFWATLGLCLLGFVLINLLDHVQTGENPFIRGVVRLGGSKKS